MTPGSQRPQPIEGFTHPGDGGTPASIRYPLDVHGVRVRIESNCPTFVEYVRRDFCFFFDRGSSGRRPHVHVTFLAQAPRWDAIPPDAVPLFTTVNSVVYQEGRHRYIVHRGDALAIYDLTRDEGIVYCRDPAALYRVAYSLLMTRIGLRLDRARRHRLHALGVTVDDVALLVLGDGGCGKTTLGLELMKDPHVGWLSDDILLVDPRDRALAFPTAPRLVQGGLVPWLPPAARLTRSPLSTASQKVQIPAWSLLARVCPSAPVGALFLCSRASEGGSSIRRVGFVEAVRGLCANALTGREFGHMMAYHLKFSPAYVVRMAALYLSRFRTFCRLAWTIPAFRFEMDERVSENAALLLREHAALRGDAPDDRVPRAGRVP